MRTRGLSLLLAGGIGSLLVLAVVASALRGPWTMEPREFDFSLWQGEAPTLPPIEEPTEPPATAPEQDALTPLDLSWVGILLGAILVAATVLLLVWLWRRFRRPLPALQAPRGQAAETPEEPEPDLPVLLRGVSSARDLLTRYAEPADAVVAAWLALEEAAERSGVHRRPSATPTEFTMVVLAATPAPPAATRELLDLYRTARFSTHPVTASDVDRAARCLAEVAESFEDFAAGAGSPAAAGQNSRGEVRG